jgi:hypothetical protein
MKINMNLNLEDIELFSPEEEQAIIKALYPATKKLLNILLENAEIDFPFRFGPKSDGYTKSYGAKSNVEDPLTLYVVRYNGYEYEVLSRLSLTQVINETLDDWKARYSRADELAAISAELKKLAAKIDAVVAAM